MSAAIVGFLIGLPCGAAVLAVALLLYNARHVPTVNDICNAGFAQPCSYPRCNCGEGRK